jgi:excisionase family DNA binding protein
MNTSDKDPNKILTVAETGELLKIPVSTLYELTRKGKIRGVKVGRRWRYLQGDVLAYFHGTTHAPHANVVSTERRQHSRIKCELTASLSGALSTTKSIVISGMVRNLSESGAYFSSLSCNGLEDGDPIEIAFSVKVVMGLELKVQGRIVHTCLNKQKGIGIKFRNQSEHAKGALRYYVG